LVQFWAVSEPERDWRRFYEDAAARQAPPPAPRKRKYGWVVATVAAIAVLAVVGWLAGSWWLRPPDYAGAPHIDVFLRAPDTIGDRDKNLGEEFKKSASDDVAAVGASPGIIDIQAAYYGTDRNKDLIYAIVMMSSNPSTADILDELITASFSGGGAEVLSSESVDAGPLGGWAKCGEYRAGGMSQVFCAWADGGSRGLVAFFYTPLEKAKGQLPEIRDAMVRRA